MLHIRQLKCEAPVNVIVKVNNRLIFGAIGAGLGAHRGNRVRTTRMWARNPLRVALGVVVRGRLVHRAPLLPSTAP